MGFSGDDVRLWTYAHTHNIGRYNQTITVARPFCFLPIHSPYTTPYLLF